MKPLLQFSLCLLLLVAVRPWAQAQQYVKDPKFASSGLLLSQRGVSINAPQNSINQIWVQPDNRMILLSVPDSLELLRIMPDGRPDSSFGKAGYFRYYPMDPGLRWGFTGAKLLSGGRFLVIFRGRTSSSVFTELACFSSKARLDSSFGVNGLTRLYYPLSSAFGRIIEQPDGKLILAGDSVNTYALKSHHILTRLHPDGRIDSSFGRKGISSAAWFPPVLAGNSSGAATVLRSDGKIVIASRARDASLKPTDPSVLGMFRLKSDGSPDSSFGINGYLHAAFDSTGLSVTDLELDASNNIIVFGYLNHPRYDTHKPFVYKTTEAGVPLAGFGTRGLATLLQPKMAVFQPTGGAGSTGYPPLFLREADEKIIIACQADTASSRAIRLCRIDTKGVLDRSFCNNGILDLNRNKKDVLRSGAIDRGGKILLGGFCSYNRFIPSFPVDSDNYFCYRLRSPRSTDPPALSVQSELQQPAIDVVPNPVGRGPLTVRYRNFMGGSRLRLGLTDLRGRLLSQIEASNGAAEGELKLQLPSSLPVGVYLLRGTDTDGNTFTRRVAVTD